MNILTDTERKHILDTLARAPDDVLLEAAQRMKQHYVDIKEDMKSLNGFVGIRFTEAPKMSLPTEPLKPLNLKQEEDKPVAAKNIEPLGPPAKRITTASKDAILGRLARPGTAEDVNRFLGRTAGKMLETAMLLRRLWDLGLVTFDGTNFGVKK